jgi:predicted transcriptional regulator
MAEYKPYSPEWHRKRYLREVIDQYVDDSEEIETILRDICDILSSKSQRAYGEFSKLNRLENHLCCRQITD